MITRSANGQRQTDRQTDRQTATLNCEIWTVWETKPRTTPQRNSGLSVGPEHVTRHKTDVDDDDEIWWPCVSVIDLPEDSVNYRLLLEQGFNITVSNSSVHSTNYEGHHFVNSQSSELVPLPWTQTRFSPLCSKLTEMKDSKGGGGHCLAALLTVASSFRIVPLQTNNIWHVPSCLYLAHCRLLEFA
jgi:hypothetical protein